jgi:hypothetical protein
LKHGSFEEKWQRNMQHPLGDKHHSHEPLRTSRTSAQGESGNFYRGPTLFTRSRWRRRPCPAGIFRPSHPVSCSRIPPSRHLWFLRPFHTLCQQFSSGHFRQSTGIFRIPASSTDYSPHLWFLRAFSTLSVDFSYGHPPSALSPSACAPLTLLTAHGPGDLDRITRGTLMFHNLRRKWAHISFLTIFHT